MYYTGKLMLYWHQTQFKTKLIYISYGYWQLPR